MRCFQLAIALGEDHRRQASQLVGRRQVAQRAVQAHLKIDEGRHDSPRGLDILRHCQAEPLALEA
jgi:hypothetical protein